MAQEFVTINGETHSPTILIGSEVVEYRTGMSGGPELARIDIQNPGGSIARFWVSAVIKNGRPVVTIATKRLNGDQHQTRITGVFNPQS